MATEIERKFLITDVDLLESDISNIRPDYIMQGYILTDPTRTIRVRTQRDKGFINIKGITVGISKPEFEYEIPISDAEFMIKNFCISFIEKTRVRYEYKGHVWEIDHFLGPNYGLIMAEVELNSEGEKIVAPNWVGEEVTHDMRYANSNLSTYPCTSWPNEWKPKHLQNNE